MQSTDIENLEQQAPEEASDTTAEATPRKPGRPAGSKNKKTGSKKKASKKKTSKKKVGKKKATKKKTGKKKASKKITAEPGVKKATRKKASKKKAGKKKRAKKKAATRAASSDGLGRLMAAVEELRDAVVEFAQTKAEDQQAAVAELRRSAQAKIADLEDAAVRSLKKLGL
ncbi:MAG: hypothetical protein ACLFQ2_11145 [Wenzhouxiangella sp.]